MNRISPIAMSLAIAACSRLATLEQISSKPATWAEYCIQIEMACINGSSAGGVSTYILFPFVVFHDETGSAEIARYCQLQGELCRLRHPTKTTPGAPQESDIAPIVPASQPASAPALVPPAKSIAEVRGLQGKIVVGMLAGDVTRLLGQPSKTEIAANFWLWEYTWPRQALFKVRFVHDGDVWRVNASAWQEQ